MSRINVYDYPAYEGDVTRVGHFESSKARRWDDADYNGDGSGGTGRGQAVWRTSGGKWVLQHWTRWQNEPGRHEYISEDEAREWLLANDCDDAVKDYLGEVAEEEDRRPGRPAIGDAINVRLGGDLLSQVDAYAGEHGYKRAEAIRVLLSEAMSS